MSVSEEQLIAQHAPMVRRLALQLVAKLPANIELDDLIQAGMLGLLDAVRRYQVSEDAQFETYAILRIRGAMLDELRSQDWLPRSVRVKARRIEEAMQRASHRMMRPASEAEIADELGISVCAYQNLLEDAHGVQLVHYEDLRRTDTDKDPMEQLEEVLPQASSPMEYLVSQDFKRVLGQALDQLPEREKLLFSLQFEQDLNQKEIACVLGVTEGRVSQLRTQAIVRIRSFLARSACDQSPGEVTLRALCAEIDAPRKTPD